ncbi:MAG: response regulator transcription factor [Negativicutes bacterium]|nr:response regulator transcription factor [Negativicutes bacterium]
MKLLLVDDNSLYLEGLTAFLQSSGIEVAGTAGDGVEALFKVEMLRPDTILMDVQMAGCGGIEATRLIKQEFPRIEIVMLSISEEDEHLFAAIRAGASGYLLKSMDQNRFIEQLQRLGDGEIPFAPGLARRILQEFGQQKKVRALAEQEAAVLSERQREVLNLLTQGLTYKEISEALAIQERTVRYHLNEILGKLHLANRTQLLAQASRFNIL